MTNTNNMTNRQESLADRTASIPSLRDALLDAKMLGATLYHRFDHDSSRDILAIAYGTGQPLDLFEDDRAWLRCRLEELGFTDVARDRLEDALANLPHTPEHAAYREHWRAA